MIFGRCWLWQVWLARRLNLSFEYPFESAKVLNSFEQIQNIVAECVGGGMLDAPGGRTRGLAA
jgi:hypothetical protein